ncbi:DUF2332 domain-containing protein [Tessaracoccus palaemonis]|uniref:DUF2332 domain-containing protein n=1 Tax=Tessaracoccus palaemonis TaxID=2829499 RepID=A0ABX8SHH6_9ACTN|nr:DUF2332 domain-containing protein [Tessaracoccus palaemonis]QXT62314.1 DUF2332 domain-containing protein [Tessaracoccus palaemonis]
MKAVHAYEAMPIDELYRWFAGEAEPTSPVWSKLCRWIAGTPVLTARLDVLPGRKRQPNLFLAAVRYLDGPTDPGPEFLDWVDGNWSAIEATILARRTQTNEPGRLAVLAPVLASLPQPVALLEIGSSAGLCLLPDRFRYRLPATIADGAAAGPDAPVLDCRHDGDPPASPADLRIALRRGLDQHPLSAADPDDARWLRVLVWPGERDREERLAAALTVAAADPPTILTGSAPDDLPLLLADLPAGATPVVMHSATLAYLARPERDAVVAAVRASGAHWLSFEGPTVVTSLRGRTPPVDGPHFVLALDGEPLAVASPHGRWVRWLPR